MSPKNRLNGGRRVSRAINLLVFLPLASRGPLYGRLLLALAMDPRVPIGRKALLGLAAAYVVSPIDLIPDHIPLVGALDDVAVVVLAIDLFLDGLPAGLVDEKLVEVGLPRAELDNDLRRIRRAIPGPVRAAAARLPDAIEALADVARTTGLERRLRGALVGQSATRRTSGTRTGQTQTQMEESPA